MDITIALGGGGAKGNSHIGVLRRLEKEGFRIQAVAGTSFGGVVAVFYALGYTPDKIEDLFASIDQKSLYGHDADESPSLLGLAGVKKWFHSVIGDRTFEDLKIPCILTAADITNGSEILFSEGSLISALLSTIAVPGIFPPNRIGDHELVDGGTLNPVPVAPARSLAPNLPVIAVVLTMPIGVPARGWNIPMPVYVPQMLIDRLSKLRYTHAMNIFLRSIDIVTRAMTEYRLQIDDPDIILRPDVADIDLLERVDVHKVARKGDEVVEAALPELKNLFVWHKRFRRAMKV